MGKRRDPSTDRPRRARAVALREEGKTYRQIGEILGVSPTRAAQLVALELRLRQENVDGIPVKWWVG